MPLIFVATPLGNLRDITLRSLDALRDADLIVAEDSRVTRRLLSAYEIPGKDIWTYHEHNAKTATETILERAQTERVVVVTDAGMPGISDPGSALVAAARAAFVCAAVLSGFDLRRFTFEGFPPRATGARDAAFAEALRAKAPSVWYEAPHRIRATLAGLASVGPTARVFLVRELTKLHEEHLAGTAAEILAKLADPVRGEIAFVIEPLAYEAVAPSEDTIDAAIDALLEGGASVSAAAKALVAQGAGERQHLYARITERKRVREGEGGEPN
jgi:16S rRNA (cytidine1402-2'-O)-methyltransferase